MAKRLASIAFSLVSLCLAPAGSKACIMSRGTDFDTFADAEIIIRAKVLGYDATSHKFQSFFKLETVETIAGSVSRPPKIWRARWVNSTFEMPDTWDRSRNIIVGLRAVIDSGGKPVLEILQQHCNPNFILDDTPENVAEIRRTLGVIREKQMQEALLKRERLRRAK